jgi:nucleoside-diphosphate-sugar epimerase
MATQVKLIIGCGYLGMRVAKLWLARGDEVCAVTRSSRRAELFSAQGVRPILADVTDLDSLAELPPAETVLFAVGYDREPGPSIHDVYVNGLRNALDSLSGDPRRFIYVSSTGVYGQTGGEYVDEESPCEPTREGGRACLAAEQLLTEHAIGVRRVVLRLAGLYGPGRVPRIEKIRQGEPVPAPSVGYLNLIHVDDAARVVLAAEESAIPPKVYCVSDGCPTMRRDYYAEVARLLDAPSPQFVEPSPAMPVARRAASSKRVGNQKMNRDLSVALKYPTYREGLAAILATPVVRREGAL